MGSVFRDNQGRDWTVSIDGYVLYRARTDGQVDLGDLFASFMSQHEAGAAIPIDPIILLELAFYGCEHNTRIAAGKINKEDFLRAMTGPAFTACIGACGNALTECFAGPQGEEQPSDPTSGAESPESGPPPTG